MTVREFNEAARAGGPKASGVIEHQMPEDWWGWRCVCGVGMAVRAKRDETEAKRQLSEHLRLCHD